MQQPTQIQHIHILLTIYIFTDSNKSIPSCSTFIDSIQFIVFKLSTQADFKYTHIRQIYIYTHHMYTYAKTITIIDVVSLERYINDNGD